jgi:plasmid stabilization system protein ParE
MLYTYLFNKDAQLEYETSLEWYAERSLKAATNFVAEVDKTLTLICFYPNRWRNAYKNFHELQLKKYPFTIIYTFEEDKKLVIVTSIFHHKRNPRRRYKKV